MPRIRTQFGTGKLKDFGHWVYIKKVNHCNQTEKRVEAPGAPLNMFCLIVLDTSATQSQKVTVKVTVVFFDCVPRWDSAPNLTSMDLKKRQPRPDVRTTKCVWHPCWNDSHAHRHLFPEASTHSAKINSSSKSIERFHYQSSMCLSSDFHQT